METTATEELLSVPEVGDRLGVSIYTVRRWIKSGALSAYRPGREYRVRESDLEEFLQTREVSPKVQRPPESGQERREEMRNLRELLLNGHEMLEDWFDKYKAERDSRKLAAMTAITGYTTMGAAQVLAELVGPPKDRESKRVYDALSRLDDLFEDIVQDLELRQEDAAGDEDVGATVTHMREFARRKTA